MCKTGCGGEFQIYPKRDDVSIWVRHHKPPKLAEFLLRRILPDGSWDTPIGDFEEFYRNLYVVATHIKYGSRTVTTDGTPSALGPALKNEYPEILNSVRFCNGPHALYFTYKDKMFREEVEAVDPSFLQMFSPCRGCLKTCPTTQPFNSIIL